MARYVLVHQNSEPDADDLQVIMQAPGVKVLDQTVRRALLVEAAEDAVAELKSRLTGWIVAEETTTPRPGPARQTIDRHGKA